MPPENVTHVGQFTMHGSRPIDKDGNVLKLMDAEDVCAFMILTLALVSTAAAEILGEAPLPALGIADGMVSTVPGLVIPHEEISSLGMRYVAAARTGEVATHLLAPYLGWLLLVDVVLAGKHEVEGMGAIRFILREAWAAHFKSRTHRLAREADAAFFTVMDECVPDVRTPRLTIHVQGRVAEMIGSIRATGRDIEMDEDADAVVLATNALRLIVDMPLVNAAVRAEMDELLAETHIAFANRPGQMVVLAHSGLRFRIHRHPNSTGRLQTCWRQIPATVPDLWLLEDFRRTSAA